MVNAIGIGLIFVMMLTGFPIYLAMALGSSLILISGGFSLGAISLYFYNSLDGFTLLAIPLYILAGSIMIDGGIAQRLVDFFNAFTKHLPGGLALVTVLTCAFYGACSASSFATAAAIGGFMIPAMVVYGYKPGTAGGLIAAAGNLGNLIPPSIFMILYGALVQYPVGTLFAGGFIPGFIVAATLAVAAVITGKRQRVPAARAATWKERGSVTVKALPSLCLPVIILGGIYTGVFTPTEAAAIACLYATILGFVYHRLTFKVLPRTILGAAKVTSSIALIMIAAIVMGKAFAFLGFPQAVTSLALGFQISWWVYLLAVFVLLLILGALMDTNAIMFVGVPMLLPAALALGINIVHFCMVFNCALMIGMVTPPIGVLSYVVAATAKIPSAEVLKGSLPFVYAMIGANLLILFVPALSTWLPTALGMLR
jgi:C4-dicarboxylate transporter, DctM subunit